MWRESYTTENRPYSLLEGSGKLAWKYEGFSDLHIRARVVSHRMAADGPGYSLEIYSAA